MKKLVIIFFAVNILSAQKTRAEILEMAVTLNWTIDSASSNQIKLFMNEEEYELGFAPLKYAELTFNGSSQSSKLIKVKEVNTTKDKYIAEINFKDAPRVKESRDINSYMGEKYCECYYLFENARVRVTKYPVKVENKTAFYYKEYDVLNLQNNSPSNFNSGNSYERGGNNSGADRAKEIAKKFDENKSSPKSYTSKYSKVEKNYRSYLKTGNYTLYSEASSKSEVLHKLKGGIYYRVIKKDWSFALIETDNGKKGYILIYDLKN